MALSGTFYYNVGSGWRLQIEWSATQSIANNQSTITAKLYWMSLGSSYVIYSSATKDGHIKIGGVTSTFSGAGLAGLSGNQKKLLHTYTRTVTHNSDGTLSINIEGMFDAEVTLSGQYYDAIYTSRTETLNTIPRNSTLTSSASWTAGNDFSVSISRASTSFDHEVKIYVKQTDGNWNWIKTLSNVGTSANTSFNTSENTDVFSVLAQRSSADTRIILETWSGSTKIGENYYYGTVTAPNASVISSSTDRYRWVDEDFPVSITRYHSSFTHTLKWTFGGFTKTITGVGTSTNWNPNSSEEQSIYAQIPNANYGIGTLQVTTYYNGVQVRTPTSVSIEWHVRNSNPTFSSSQISYADVDSAITAITGNDQYIVQNKSNLRAYVNTAATAVNGATMDRYEISINGITKTLTTTGYSTIGAISASSNVTLSVKAIDSRGNFTTVTKTVTIVPYSSPSVNTNAVRLNNFEAQTTLSLSGSISLVNVAGSNKNSVQSAQYRYRQSGGSWGSWTNFSYSPSGSSYTATNVQLTLDNLKVWDIEVKVVDKFDTVTVSRVVPKGQPLFFIDSQKNSVGVNTMPSGSRDLEIGNGGLGTIRTRGLFGGYSDNYYLYDHNNGNVTLSALGGELYLGYQNTTKVRLSGALYTSDGSTQILDTSGNFQKDVVFNNNALVSSNGGSTNIDHAWHDDGGGIDGKGAWHFISDGEYKQQGNSTIVAGYYRGYSDSGGYLDSYLNLKPLPTVNSTAYWHLDSISGTMLIKAPWGSSSGPLELRGNNHEIQIHGNGTNNLSLVGSDHVYIEFYPQGLSSRKGYIGFSSANTLHLDVTSQEGEVRIKPNNGAAFFRFMQLGSHDGIQGASKGILKFLSSGDTVQVRNGYDTAYGTIQAYHSDPSDARLKSNIRHIEGRCLDDVRRTKVYTYEMNGKEGKNVGLLAHEAPQIFVNKGKTEEEFDSIDVYGMVSFLWKAVQELSDYVDYLNDRMKKRR